MSVTIARYVIYTCQLPKLYDCQSRSFSCSLDVIVVGVVALLLAYLLQNLQESIRFKLFHVSRVSSPLCSNGVSSHSERCAKSSPERLTWRIVVLIVTLTVCRRPLGARTTTALFAAMVISETSKYCRSSRSQQLIRSSSSLAQTLHVSVRPTRERVRVKPHFHQPTTDNNNDRKEREKQSILSCARCFIAKTVAFSSDLTFLARA